LAIMASAAAIIIAHSHPSGVIPNQVLCRTACDVPMKTPYLRIFVRHKNGSIDGRD
jgi:hypothetical protein